VRRKGQDGDAREIAGGQRRPDGQGADDVQDEDHQNEDGGRHGQLGAHGDADRRCAVVPDEGAPV
jgi:hypothetical protein